MDLFLELSKNPTARSIISQLGLPLPQPPVLRRARAAWTERICDDTEVVVYGSPNATLLTPVQSTLAASGARVIYSGDREGALGFRGPAEAWGEPVRLRDEPEENERIRALVLDLSGLRRLKDLEQLHASTAPWIRALDRSGRVIALVRPLTPGLEPRVAAVRQAVEGFTRSLAKELGRRGVTVNLLRVSEGAEDRVPGPLRFLLSAHSAFITGQPISVTSEARGNTPSEVRAPLFGKRALVTGAARGIGAATARILAREGAHVIMVDRPDADGDASRLAREIDGSMFLLDIATPEAPRQLVEHLREHGPVDIVVHNAGITRDKTLGRMTAEQWQLVLDVNLGAAIRISDLLLEQALVREEGRLIFLASISGLAGNAGQTNYAASKAGLIGYVRALAEQVAPRGITANAIAPGLIETQMTAKMPVAIREAARRLSALNQGGLPEDVAEAITFLSLSSSDGVTGSVLRVCGGALVGA